MFGLQSTVFDPRSGDVVGLRTEDPGLGTGLPPALGAAALSWSIAATTLAGTSAALSGRWAWTITAVARLIAALLPTTVTRAVSRSLA